MPSFSSPFLLFKKQLTFVLSVSSYLPPKSSRGSKNFFKKHSIFFLHCPDFSIHPIDEKGKKTHIKRPEKKGNMSFGRC